MIVCDILDILRCDVWTFYPFSFIHSSIIAFLKIIILSRFIPYDFLRTCFHGVNLNCFGISVYFVKPLPSLAMTHSPIIFYIYTSVILFFIPNEQTRGLATFSTDITKIITLISCQRRITSCLTNHFPLC